MHALVVTSVAVIVMCVLKYRRVHNDHQQRLFSISLLLFAITTAHADALMFRDAIDDGEEQLGTVATSSLSRSADASSSFFTDTPISSRFERVLADGIEPPQLTLRLGIAAVPQDILALLTMYLLRWESLDGNLQRLLLWDAGYVLSSDGTLAKVYTRCGLTMDNVVLNKTEYDQLGCLSTSCPASSTSGVYRSMECPDSMVAQVAKCATRDQVQVVSSASFWAQEANNTDIPQPLIYRNTARTYSIQTTQSSSSNSNSALQPAAPSGQCPTRLNLIIPCTMYDDSEADIDPKKWCAPKSTGRIAPLLRQVTNELNSYSNQTGSGGSDVGVWIAAAVVCFVVVALCIGAQIHMWRMKQNAAEAISEQKQSGSIVIEIPPRVTRTTGDYFEAVRSTTEGNGSTVANEFSMFTPVLDLPTAMLRAQQQQQRWTNNDNNNGLAKSASYSDIICSSEVMMEFQCDPVVIEKRVPMVDLKFDTLVCQGASGEIHTGSFNGNRVALKQVLRIRMNDPKEIEKFAREIQLHAALQHPNIVPLLGVAWNSFQNLVMVMEYTSGGDLLRALRCNGKQWTWTSEKLRVAFGISKALAYLHGLHEPVIHRDIKSRNILINDQTFEPLLCDFGASCSVANLSVDFVTTDPAGTILWSAPEVITAQDYSEKADVYSFGVVLTEIDTCKLPYKDEKDSTGRQVQAIRIARMVVDDQIKPTLTPECPDFIRKIAQACLHHDPDRRPSSRELLLYFTDPGRYSLDWDCSNNGGDLGSSAEWEMKRGSLFCL